MGDKNDKTVKPIVTSYEGVTMGLHPTANPKYYQISLPVDEEHKGGLSHTGRAFKIISKDEAYALVEMGFKPFSVATLDVVLTEKKNIVPTKPTLLNFEFLGEPIFTGGWGKWREIFKEVPASSEKQTVGDLNP